VQGERYMRYRLKGKRAFITGTNRGIGLKIVETAENL